MPIAGTFDLYESGTHHGLMSSGFLTPFLFMIGMTSGHTNKLWRSKLIDAMRALLLSPGIHKKFEMANGEAAIAGLKVLLKLHHDPHPWDDLWRAIAVEHPFRDAWWEDRNLLPLLDRVEVPVYLGCDWQNVPLHLPHTFTAYERLRNSKHLQVAMMGAHGLAWPWESLHIEAIAWFDQWLKGQNTGILDGPHFRYLLPEAEGWRTTDVWPIREVVYHAYALRADGGLSRDEGQVGSRTYMNLGGGLNRPRASETDPPPFLQWTAPPLPHDLDLIGPIELRLDATCTAPDTAFIAVLQDVDENGNTINVTAGYLRASVRDVDEAASKHGAPFLPCRIFEPVPIEEKVSYRIPIVPNARHFRTGHQLRLYLTTDDQNADRPALLEFRHASVGTSSFNTIFSSSRLLLPVLL
jgi:predicted acyl esterase